MTTLEQLEKVGRLSPRTIQDAAAAREKAATAPGELSDVDLAVLDYFGSPQEAERARDARDRALHPPADPPAVAPVEAPAVAAEGGESESAKLGTFIGSVLKRYVMGRLKAAEERLDRLAALEQRVKQLEDRPAMHDAGTWEPGKMYETGAAVTHGGSLWACTGVHVSGDVISHDHFRLAVKRGKDGKDGKDARTLR